MILKMGLLETYLYSTYFTFIYTYNIFKLLTLIEIHFSITINTINFIIQLLKLYAKIVLDYNTSKKLSRRNNVSMKEKISRRSDIVNL